MGIRELLKEIADTYDGSLGTGIGVHAQDLLRQADELLAPSVPGGFEVEGHGGNGGAAHTPWIGVLDPDITDDPKEGLYLAYIFSADLKTVALTLQQGVTELEDKYGKGQKLREYLESRGSALHDQLPSDLVADWGTRPEFKSKAPRARAYEAASVVARCYAVDSLPTETDLRKDLWCLAEVLRQAATVEKGVAVSEVSEEGGAPLEFKSSYQPTPPQESDGLEEFDPKDGSDYVAHIAARTMKKSRKHEVLVDQFGRYAMKRGFKPITKKQHPKDLVLRKGEEEWLVEVKAVKGQSARTASREALAQLYEYSHFLYDGSKPRLLALFDKDIKVFAPYLEGLGVASVWKTPAGWAGTPSAVKWGLVD